MGNGQKGQEKEIQAEEDQLVLSVIGTIGQFQFVDSGAVSESVTTTQGDRLIKPLKGCEYIIINPRIIMALTPFDKKQLREILDGNVFVLKAYVASKDDITAQQMKSRMTRFNNFNAF